MITLMFDDTFLNEYTWASPLLLSKGVVACSAVISDRVDLLGALSQKQLLSLQSLGWEILSHTKTHPLDLTVLSEEQIIVEMKESLDALHSMGLNVESLVYPCHAHNGLVDSVARRFYRSARGRSFGTNFRENIKVFELSGILADDCGLSELTQLVVDNKDGWQIFYWHLQQYAGCDVPEKLGVIGDMIDFIKPLGVEVVTVRQALNKWGL